MRNGTNNFSFNRLSIQYRLPILICALLLSSIAIYGFANYYSLKKATLSIGKERLSSITDELGSMFGQSVQSIEKIYNSAAAQNTLLKCLKSNGQEFRKETIVALNNLQRDSTWISIELLNSNLVTVARSDKYRGKVKIDLGSVLKYNPVGPNSTKIGRIIRVKGTMYYPIITSVCEEKRIIGYIISWIEFHTSQKTVTQISRLVGTSAAFYLVNTDGSLWTDMTKPVGVRPIGIAQKSRIIEYTSSDSRQMLACKKKDSRYRLVCYG